MSDNRLLRPEGVVDILVGFEKALERELLLCVSDVFDEAVELHGAGQMTEQTGSAMADLFVSTVTAVLSKMHAVAAEYIAAVRAEAVTA